MSAARPPGSPEPDSSPAAEPIDEQDEELLRLLRECHEQCDPMPDDMIQRSLFALAASELEAEVLRLAEQHAPRLAGSGVRGEEARVITFDSDSLTVMIRVSRQGSAIRIDGWLAPPQDCRIELRTGQRVLTSDVDSEGRFAMDGIPHGLARLVVQLSEPSMGEAEKTFLTPAIVL